MKSYSKIGLRDARNVLKQLRQKYQRSQVQGSQPIHHNKTFIEEQSLELYEQHSQQSENKVAAFQQHSRLQDPVAEVSEIKHKEKQEVTFCDKLILKNLEATLKTYQEDLQVLTDNRSFLEEQIQFLSEKIRKLRQTQAHNKVLASQNVKSKELLQVLIQQYHMSMQALFKSKLAQQEAFNAFRGKLRKVLKETGEDYHYVGFVKAWNRHIGKMMSDLREIKSIISKAEANKEEKPKVQKIVVAAAREQNNYDQQYLAPDEPKPKKRLSQSQKASLLGDLKSFAKSFKLPTS